MALLLGERAHEVAIVELVDVCAIDPSIFEGRQCGCGEQLTASTVAVSPKWSKPDTSNTDSGHTDSSD
jgi:hypothetical protein